MVFYDKEQKFKRTDMLILVDKFKETPTFLVFL